VVSAEGTSPQPTFLGDRSRSLGNRCGAALGVGKPRLHGRHPAGLARVTGTLLNVLGHSTSVSGNTVATESFGISVVTACTGIFVLGLYLVAVIAYPCRWISKLLGVLLGIGGVFMLNLIRLISLFYVGMHMPQHFDAVHQLVWQSLMIAFVVLLWLFWVGRWTHAPHKA